jgi:inhibitor of KinA
MADFRITVAGDSALNLTFADTISDETSSLIRLTADELDKHPIEGVTELVPTFCSLMVCYDPLVIGFDELSTRLTNKLSNVSVTYSPVRVVVEIPTCYGGEYGPDLPFVAEHAGLTEEEVIRIHSGRDYLIDMLGFLPGFAYLGGLDERIHTPRLEEPRTRIEAGSVGIGGGQTGVYPLPSPGGWQIIGRTPIRPYDPDREKPFLYEAGQYLRFVPISPEQYAAIEQQARGTHLHLPDQKRGPAWAS